MFKINNKYTYDVVLVFLLVTLNIFHSFFSVSIVDFEEVNISWVSSVKDHRDWLNITFDKFTVAVTLKVTDTAVLLLLGALP